MQFANLANACEARPFDHLGKQSTSQGTVIRCWQPDAETAELLPATGKAAPMRLVEPGLFQFDGDIEGTYQVRFANQHSSWVSRDPWSLPAATFRDRWCEPVDLYQNMGAHLSQFEAEDGTLVQGTRFCVYAPNARSVALVGDFNHWDGRRHPMASNDDGIWRLFVPDLAEGERYKFEIKDRFGNLLPHKADPYGFQHEQFPSFASIVFNPDTYQWHDDDWMQRPTPDHRSQPMSIYEVHVGSWKRHPDGSVYSWTDLIDHLIPYLLEMGYTHVELLPPMEHPYDGSWGYQPLGLFAPTSRFGHPNEFKAFVDACHHHGIAVIVDWVPAHFPADAHGLARFDGTPLFEYENPERGWHPDWQSYIYDFGRETVQNFLISSAVYWLEQYHIDGLRVDAVASMLYHDYSREDGEWIPNVDGGNENYEAIHFIRRFNETVYARHPNCYTIAEESTAFPMVSRPTSMGGLGFGFKWNMGWMHDSLEYMKREPIHRPHHHGELTFSLLYSFDENFVLPLSHDEVVHGKGTILGRMPGDEWQQNANLRAYYAFMYAHPGKKLNFMGNEFAQAGEWQYQDQLQWWVLQHQYHDGSQKLVKALNHIHRQQPAMHELDHEPEGFEWLLSDDAEHSVVAFLRFDKDRSKPVLVVANFTPVPRPDFRVALPGAASAKLLLNTDEQTFGGSQAPVLSELTALAEPYHQRSHSVVLTLPPLAVVYYQLEMHHEA